MLIFMDGFDHYATADLNKKWSAVGGSGVISSTLGRRGGGAYNMSNLSSSYYVQKSIAAGSSFITGFALSFSGAPNGTQTLCKFMDSGSTQCELNMNAAGQLVVTRAGTALTGGTSTLTLASGTFYYIEFKVTISSSIAANSCKVRVNGADVITVTTGQSTKSTANSTANQFVLGANAGSGIGISTVLYDDFYLCDANGTTNNDFLGDVRIDTLMPNGDGSYSAFTPNSGTTHYTRVNEAKPDTTTYNDGISVGDRDSYQLADLASLTSQTIYGVQVNAATQKDDAGARSVATFIRTSSTNKDGATAVLGTSQVYVSQVFETDASSSAFTQTSVNAMEAGITVTA